MRLVMDKIRAAQLTCTIYNSVVDRGLAKLQEIGVRSYHAQPSRATVLRRTRGILGDWRRLGARGRAATRLTFHVPLESAEDALQALISACGLQVPGAVAPYTTRLKLSLNPAGKHRKLLRLAMRIGCRYAMIYRVSYARFSKTTETTYALGTRFRRAHAAGYNG